MPTSHNLRAAISTGTGIQVHDDLSVVVPDGGLGRTIAVLGVLTESFEFDGFTDGGAAVGTVQFVAALPAGAVVLGSKVLVSAGFAGDTSAALTIGDGSDADRYNTSTINIFATAAAGVESGVPSGSKLLVAENRPTLTCTTAADWTSVTAGACTISIYYIQTA